VVGGAYEMDGACRVGGAGAKCHGIDGDRQLPVGELAGVVADRVDGGGGATDDGCSVESLGRCRGMPLQQSDHVDAVDQEVLHVTDERHVFTVVRRCNLQLINVERVAFARYIRYTQSTVTAKPVERVG